MLLHLLDLRAAKFHKSSVTFWAKANLQPKNKKKSLVATESMGIADLEISSVLLCSNRFYCQANLKIIPLNLLNIGSEICRQARKRRQAA